MLGLGPLNSELLVVISPELMAYLGEAGWSRQQVQRFLFEKTQLPAREWIAWERIDHPDSIVDREQLMGSVAEASRITVVPGGGRRRVHRYYPLVGEQPLRHQRDSAETEPKPSLG